MNMVNQRCSCYTPSPNFLTSIVNKETKEKVVTNEKVVARQLNKCKTSKKKMEKDIGSNEVVIFDCTFYLSFVVLL